MSRDDAIQVFFITAVVATICFFILSGCATTDIPKPIIGEVRVEELRINVPVACIHEADLPKRPASAMPGPDADIARKAAGAVADARAISAYADQVDAAIKACVEAGGKL